MKANELRIGNYSLIDGQKIGRVVEIRENYLKVSYKVDEQKRVSLIDIDRLKTIALTEEWLVKFGFEFINHSFRLHKFCINLKENEFYILTETHRVFLKYVHQLQNLFFALTGQELEINEGFLKT
jgi:hypothetical protein